MFFPNRICLSTTCYFFFKYGRKLESHCHHNDQHTRDHCRRSFPAPSEVNSRLFMREFREIGLSSLLRRRIQIGAVASANH
jgi:hypothetical protein